MDSQPNNEAPLSNFLQSLSQSAVKTAVEEAAKDVVAEKEPEASEVSSNSAESEDVSAELSSEVSAAASAEETSSGATDQVDSSGSTVEAQGEPSKDSAVQDLSGSKTQVVIKALKSMEQNLQNIIRLLEADAPIAQVKAVASASEPADVAVSKELELAGISQSEGQVVEGVFDGQGMVGSDGKTYSVPPNYASKSKLVEGDMLKLTITAKGSFIYKQIGPIERSRVVADLGFDTTTGEYYATKDDKRWSVIKASVTYFKGEPGDEIVLLIPESAPSKWAAVENVIKKEVL